MLPPTNHLFDPLTDVDDVVAIRAPTLVLSDDGCHFDFSGVIFGTILTGTRSIGAGTSAEHRWRIGRSSLLRHGSATKRRHFGQNAHHLGPGNLMRTR